MSNNAKPIPSLVGTRVQHDYSKDKGKITKTRQDIRGYCYFVEWDLMPERNDWYQLNVLEKIDPLMPVDDDDAREMVHGPDW